MPPLRGRGKGIYRNSASRPSSSQPSTSRPSASQQLPLPNDSLGSPDFGLSAAETSPAVNPTHETESVADGEIDIRELIYVEPATVPRRFMPQSVTRTIMNNVLSRMPIPADKWRNYPAEAKEVLFKDFMAQYRFASDRDRSVARSVWDRTCMERYPDTLKNARTAALKAANTNNLADTKGHGPRGMRTEVWDGLVDIWLTPEWQRKSDAGRTNRAVMPEASLHTGGSISFGQHKQRMEERLQNRVSFRDVYAHTHQKKSGEYVSEHSKNFIESLDTAMTQKYGEDSSVHPMVDADVWLDASGGHKKGRIHGIGHSLDLGIGRSQPSSFSSVVGPSQSSLPQDEELNQLVNTVVENAVERLFLRLAPMLGLQTPPPPPPSDGGPHRDDHQDGADDH